MNNSPCEIALIDDDDMFRRSASTLLSRTLKKQVRVFESGEAAVSHLEQNNNVDIILSDINMPGMDGLELLQRVKKSHPEKIVIMMSGYPDNEEAALHHGADAYISKPFSIKTISELVRSFTVN